MASTGAQSTLSTTISFMMTTSSLLNTTNSSNKTADDYHTPLLAIYSVVLICGTISLSLMMHIMKSSTTSATSIAVLNLIFAHFIFLLTVPFRIYYYAGHEWKLSHEWCKMVSSMIHIHMYMSFVLYVIILITRLLTFYHKAEPVVSFRRNHALLASALVWIVVIVIVPCIIYFIYGKKKEGPKINGTPRCFDFGKSIESTKVFNYITSILIILISIVLTALQANVLWILYRKHRQGCTSQQDFAAQLKSLCFALIMVVCFIPYHIFRLFYLEDIELQNINEVFLSLTTFNCLDMLTFLGRRTCNICSSGRAI
ncbi:probable G-protein coupled receptor 141 [Embiotoca jacksoni]|uniref:probable G-protein coupled receptor 141 n=1 Tax=Embiotoca jacksoni TaxID=100190 RepID=UPI003704A375